MRLTGLRRNLTLVLASSGFLAACAIVSVGLNTRSLGVADFGVLVLIQAYVSLISSVATLESWQAVIRFGTVSRRRLGFTLASGLVLDAGVALLAAVGAIAGVALFGEFAGVSREVRWLAIVYSASLAFGLTGTPKGYLRLTGRYDLLAANQIGQAVATALAAAALFIAEASLAAYVIVFALIEVACSASIVLIFAAVVRSTASRPLNPIGSAGARAHFRRFAVAAAGTSLLSTFLNGRRQIPLLIVAAVTTADATGLFAFSARLANVVQRLSVPLNQVLFPEMVRMAHASDRGAARRALHRATLVAVAAACLAVVIAGWLSAEIAIVAGGAAFAAAAPVFTVLFAAECIALAGLPLQGFVQGARGARPLILVAAAALAVSACAAIVLGTWFGGMGVAYASVLCSILTLVGAIALAVATSRHSDVRTAG